MSRPTLQTANEHALDAGEFCSLPSIPQTNREFLQSIFADKLEESEAPFVVSFMGRVTPQSPWSGRAWRFGTDLQPDSNNYFTLATYRATNGRYFRQDKHCHRIFGVMFDDIGTKSAPLERFSDCPPSYVIETSPGNFQLGYLFAEPQEDHLLAQALLERAAHAGLCDPGAKGPTTRLGRLPYGVNGKYDPAHHCRLVAWRPDARYRVEDLEQRLCLMSQSDDPNSTVSKSKGKRLAGNAVYIPRQSENPVIQALKAKGLYKRRIDKDRHDITCPWLAEHTDELDSGACYFEPSIDFPIGGFKCQHSHGDRFHISALLEILDVDKQTARDQAVILSMPGEMLRVLRGAELELATTGRFFSHGGALVEVRSVRSVDVPQALVLTIADLKVAMASVALWLRRTKEGDWIPTDPPSQYVNTLIGRSSYENVPELRAISPQPFFGADHRIVTSPGFDAASGIYGAFAADQFHVPPNPSKDDALQAVALLEGLLEEFAFAHEHDKAAALAGILTAAIRPSLQVAPMFHIRAHQAGSGKSYLSSLLAAFASPTPPRVCNLPDKEEELQKLVIALLVEAPSVLMFDNLTSDIRSVKTLCTLLSEPQVTGRLLGQSKTVHVSTATLVLSSGNNVGPTGDMTRRCVVIQLDPQVEIAASRRFTGNPVKRVQEARPMYVAAALTVVLAYVKAGLPKQDLRPLVGFTNWSDLVRCALRWLGYVDPAHSLFEEMAEDPERTLLGRLLKAWHERFQDAPTTVRDVLSSCLFGIDELQQAVSDIAEERGVMNRRRLGKWISRSRGRVVEGLRFDKAGGTDGGSERWMVVKVEGKL